MLLAIAWRNLWRNRRRTIIASAAVFMAVVLAMFMLSMKYGSMDQMVAAGVNQVGNIQVHDTGYWENKSLDRAFFNNDQIEKVLNGYPEIKRVIPHLETFSLASFGNRTKGIAVSGIDPKLEDLQTGLSQKIVKGHYFSNKHDVLIGNVMAEYLKMDVGDSIVLLGQGYRGITAYGIFKVGGIFHSPSHDMNSQMLYMSLPDAQQFVYPFQKGLLTGLSVYLHNSKAESRIKAQLQQNLGNGYEIIPWETILSDLLETVAMGRAGNQIFVMILYIIAAFGIFSTVLMMTMEKRKQYAVMISIGMQRSHLVWVSMLETIMISLVGVIAALAIIVPVLTYLHFHPIPVTGDIADIYLLYNIDPVMPFAASPSLFISQTAIILTLSFLSAFYPIIYILKFNVLNAYRH